MADDKDNKTHDPTAKRLDDARKKGEVATAPEMRHAVMLLAMWVGTVTVGLGAVGSLGRVAAGLWSGAGDLRIGPDGAHRFASGLFGELLRDLGPLFGLFVAAAVLIGVAQGRPSFSPARLKPKWSKLSPVAGLKRMLGLQGLVEFGKTLVKTALVLGVAAWVLKPYLAGAQLFVGLEPMAIVALTGRMASDLLWSILLLVGALAAADFVYQHRAFLGRMRMSLQELKDEHKENDGSPEVKARQRQIGAARVRSRMMAAVPTASVIVTNPTHYAVALRYDHGAMRAPVVVAKGVDRIALKIREIAGEHKVPIVESPPLARALFATAEVDRPIPVEHYAAVAEIISYVLELARSRRR